VQSKLNRLEEHYWKGIKQIILFGYGRQGRKVLPTLQKDFEILFIIENDICKIGKCIEGVRIVGIDEARPKLKNHRIIVMTSEHYYQEIKEQLQREGLIENVDFTMFQQFITEWYYKFKKKVCILKTDISVTPLCSLKCEKCHLFMPYWKDKQEKKIETIKQDIDSYFRCVDYVVNMDIVGGEPFLYRQLNDVLKYLCEKYKKKIGYLGIITNGTILPSSEILETMNKYGIGVSVSDYSKELGDEDYTKKVNQFCDLLRSNNIDMIRNKEIEWFDFGFPEQTFFYRGQEVINHMACCNSIIHILDEKKFYGCSVAWAAQKSGLYPVDDMSYIDLESIDNNSIESRKIILEHSLGNIERGFLMFCQVCGGFGIDNNNIVLAAKQIENVKGVEEI